jgi:hypothetical protein
MGPRACFCIASLDRGLFRQPLRLSGQDWVVAGTFGGESEARIPPFDAVAIDVGALWDTPAGAAGEPRNQI